MSTDTTDTTRTDSGSMLSLTPLTGEALQAYVDAEPINPAGLPTSYDHGNRLTAEGTKVDPIVVEIVEGTLASVEMEVETAIARTSRSPMIRDAHDFRAGIHDRQLRKLTGRSYSALVHPIVRDFPLDTMKEGDVFFHNDVYESEGGIGHLPDLCVTVPVFHEGKVVCFVQAFGHHDDIGGATPGSMPSGATRKATVVFFSSSAMSDFPSSAMRAGACDESGDRGLIAGPCGEG